MDYREIENRMERNRDLIKLRAYDRVIEEALQAQKASKPPRASLIAALRAFAVSLKQSKVEPQSQRQINPIVNMHSPNKMHPGKG